jgi:hypothetical protein
VVILPFKIKLGKVMEIHSHPKLSKIMKIISEDEELYRIYFNYLTLFSKITLKIFPEKD